MFLLDAQINRSHSWWRLLENWAHFGLQVGWLAAFLVFLRRLQGLVGARFRRTLPICSSAPFAASGTREMEAACWPQSSGGLLGGSLFARRAIGRTVHLSVLLTDDAALRRGGAFCLAVSRCLSSTDLFVAHVGASFFPFGHRGGDGVAGVRWTAVYHIYFCRARWT